MSWLKVTQVPDPREVARQCTKYLRRLATQDRLDNESIPPAKYDRRKLDSRPPKPY